MRGDRRTFVLLFCLSLAGVAYGRAPRRPDVLLITIDTLRADHVQCYGYSRVRTPALNRLAQDGIRFANAFTPSPITTSSHASILTGRFPSAHGVLNFGMPLDRRFPTWAEFLRESGYRTAAFIGSLVLDSRQMARGFDRGFESYENFPSRHSSAMRCHPDASKSGTCRGPRRWGRLERRAMDVVGRAKKWLQAHPAGPRFLWVHLYDPHDPYIPPPPFSITYRDHPYDGEIAYADSALLHLLNFLQSQHGYAGALIVVVGDHGEGLGEHREETHGTFLYDATLHVPLIVKLPAAQSAGTLVAGQVRTTDILPTVLDLLHIGAGVSFDGESLQPLWLGKDAADRPAWSETDYPLGFGWAPLRAMRAGGAKLVEAPRPEFYDLHSDPSEIANRYEPWNPKVQQLRELMADVQARLPRHEKNSSGAVSPATIAQLRALGYLGGASSAPNLAEPSLLPDPKDEIEVQNLLHRAMLAAEDRDPRQARQTLDELLRREPDFPAGLMQLGQIEMQALNYRQAAEAFRKAGQARPGDALAAFHEGEAWEREGDLDAARSALEQSLQFAPQQFEARLLLGRVLLRMGDAKSAQDELQAAELIEPRQAALLELLAKAYRATGNYAAAREAAAKAARLRRQTQR